MQTQVGLETWLPLLNSELQTWRRPPTSPTGARTRLSVTISRQSGAGAHVVARKLVEYFRVHAPDEECPWSIFDRNLVEQVLQDHHLPQRFARFMPEDRTSEVGDILDELLGHHPPSSLLVQLAADTILALARRGNVVLIGRGANIITGGLDNVLHVRLVASLERRIAHIQETHGLGRKASLDFICHEDRGRQRYLKKYFDRHPDDPKLYHLIINTDLVSYDQAAQMICRAALNGLQGRVEQPSAPLLGARSESRLQAERRSS